MTKKGALARGGLFDSLMATEDAVSAPEWKLAELPDLRAHGVRRVFLDFETDGLKWWAGDKPIGFAVKRPGAPADYFSWSHKSDAPRHDEATCRRWFREQLEGVEVCNASVKTEVQHYRAWTGSPMDSIPGLTVTDVQHHAALLDDHRREFSQDVLCTDFLPGERKVEVVGGVKIEPSRMAWHHPGIVAARATADVRQVELLRDTFSGMLAEQSLGRVLALENACVFPSCEMEWNGALLDVEKLRRWAKEARTSLEAGLLGMRKRLGFPFNPDSPGDWNRLFAAKDISSSEMTKGGSRKSFTEAVLASVVKATDDPDVAEGKRLGKLKDLLSKYLDKWAKTVGDDGILRFNLHQLRGDEGGTVSGRFASSAISLGAGKGTVGANVQAVLALEKQMDLYGPDWIVRELFVAEPGKKVVSADAEQIEYRLFGHRAGNPRVVDAYKKDPRMSFHEFIHGLLLPSKPDLGYKSLKNLNFMQIYGGGVVKLGTMLGEISQSVADELNRADARAREDSGGKPYDLPSRRDPRMAGTMKIKAIYDRELPEVKPLIRKMTDQATELGFITTLLGRRARFQRIRSADGRTYVERPHKALNADIQGSAGDVMKKKMVEAHAARAETGLTARLTVHDQIMGDGDEGTARALAKILDRQSFPELRIPILWATSEGPTWLDCEKPKDLEKLRKMREKRGAA